MQSIERQKETRTKEEKELAYIRKATDLLSRFQCSKARKCLQSNGLGNHTDAEVVDQMKRKHPACKTPITGC